ncbi:NINE protein [Janthinobacterium agaricidamnosum]|uniref:Putative membrane protein n=1 Tax=Janthinobacterium agaricidamnosum NBRC 102515 = DSM 9628 TaxID=1349767 RepID=W0VA63_9BURK|nr:TM2 domain-containing protein [Janthinobacterium agaricidamnosum]CDG84781.1 putative membrane protein [Janthinobacterium agaricidamnosum NBRC 102515 = DSM 9628]
MTMAVHAPAARSAHSNKTFATLLAFLLGAVGAHRFYLRGFKDGWGWLHCAALPASLLLWAAMPGADWFYQILPLTVSGLAGFLEALVLGLMPDEKWDAAFNADSCRQSASDWPLAVLLVATLMVGAGTLIATIARLFDLLYTGGSYG